MSGIDVTDKVSRSIRHHLLAGVLASAGLVGGAGTWAAVTHLSGAVVASGNFVANSYVKKVQHPTGGVVEKIFVQEGDKVNAGEVLVQLNPTHTRANLAIVTKRLDELAARLARLEAERDDLTEIVFPEGLLARRGVAEVALAMHSEKRLFESRRHSREGNKAQLAERIAQYEHEVEGLKAQEIAYDESIDILGKEIAALSGLREQRIVSDQRLNSLKTQLAMFGGERSEKIASQARTTGQIAETRLQIAQIEHDLKSEAGRELAEVQAQVAENLERKAAAEDELRRSDIVAPQSGIVHQLAVHTVGGVVTPADPIMLIVPEGDELALEVRIQPKDIDQIQLGHKAMLRMSAFNLRTTPVLTGYVSLIAADLATDEKTGVSYYLVRLSVPHAELTKLKDLTLVAGMPAEAMIQTGERTVLSYLVKPLADQISRAFREE
ncbi:HlyD family type I secretion periplasmic adaptor subunit [Mesorhizobium abyssinicae]|uniref:HlyD family type I secretion periplasmic adaptor subunit n=1 Tax=Mesorhizobium abyssinicae TaxID=1209958 RepID=UPI003395E922